MNFLVAITLYEKQTIKGSALQYYELYLAAHIFQFKRHKCLVRVILCNKNHQCDRLNTLPSCDILMGYRRKQDTLGFDFQFSPVQR